jgi:hypothetical protein
MEESYIEEKAWVKCTIDGIIYDCYFKHTQTSLLKSPWVDVTVRKYVTKKWWFFKWKWEEFECNSFPELNYNEWEWINETVYFKSDCIKDWVKGALNQREIKIRQKKLEKEKQKNLKVLKEL